MSAWRPETISSRKKTFPLRLVEAFTLQRDPAQQVKSHASCGVENVFVRVLADDVAARTDGSRGGV